VVLTSIHDVVHIERGERVDLRDDLDVGVEVVRLSNQVGHSDVLSRPGARGWTARRRRRGCTGRGRQARTRRRGSPAVPGPAPMGSFLRLLS